MDPSALGARPDGLGAAAGRPLRGLMGQQTQEEPRLGLGNMRAPMTSARPLAGQVPPVRTVRQPIAQPEPVRNIRQPIASREPAFVPEEEAAMEDAGEAMLEETSVPVEAEVEPEIAVDVVEDTVDVVEDTVEETTTMQRPTALLKPIRGTLRPLEEEEAGSNRHAHTRRPHADSRESAAHRPPLRLENQPLLPCVPFEEPSRRSPRVP